MIVLLGVCVLVAVIICKLCVARRKAKREKYMRGIPSEIEMEMRDDGTVVITKGIDMRSELYKVDEAPASEEITPKKEFTFPEVRKEEEEHDSSGS